MTTATLQPVIATALRRESSQYFLLGVRHATMFSFWVRSSYCRERLRINTLFTQFTEAINGNITNDNLYSP